MFNQEIEKKIPILMYHSISNEASLRFRPFAVAPELFAEHMAYLYRHAYVPLTVSQFVQIREEALPEKPVVITFDDGFADFAANAWPVLNTYHFAATLYVTTGHVGRTSVWLRHDDEADRPMLTWQQVREISDSGIECGAHTHTHPQLDTIPFVRAQKEIVQSKAMLEEHIKQPVYSFAYPYGYLNDRVVSFVKQAGFTSACAVKFAMSTSSTDQFVLKRLIVKSGTTVEKLSALLVGHDTTLFSSLYMRTRTPLWQMVRRSSALITQREYEGLHTL